MLKSLLSLLFTLYFTGSFGCQMFSSDVHVLFKSKLVVTATIVPSNKRYYKVIINSFLKKAPGITLTKGDTLSILRTDFNYFGQKKAEYESSYLLYLTPYKDKWFTVGGDQNIYSTIDGKLPFHICDKRYIFTSKQYIKMKQHLFMCFHEFYDNRFKIKLKQADYIQRLDAMDAVNSFYECCHYPESHHLVPLKIIDDIKLNRTYVNPDSIVHLYCHILPKLPMSYTEYTPYFQNLLPDSIQNKTNKLSGNIAVQFIVETDSTRSDYSINHGISSAYDTLAINLVKQSPLITPGTFNGKPARCLMHLLIRIDHNLK